MYLQKSLHQYTIKELKQIQKELLDVFGVKVVIKGKPLKNNFVTTMQPLIDRLKPLPTLPSEIIEEILLYTSDRAINAYRCTSTKMDMLLNERFYERLCNVDAIWTELELKVHKALLPENASYNSTKMWQEFYSRFVSCIDLFQEYPTWSPVIKWVPCNVWSCEDMVGEKIIVYSPFFPKFRPLLRYYRLQYGIVFDVKKCKIKHFSIKSTIKR